eukprot:3908699-Pyramimonas_sp.AAC.1
MEAPTRPHLSQSVGTEWFRHVWADSWRVPLTKHRAPYAEVWDLSQLGFTAPSRVSNMRTTDARRYSAGPMILCVGSRP